MRITCVHKYYDIHKHMHSTYLPTYLPTYMNTHIKFVTRTWSQKTTV